MIALLPGTALAGPPAAFERTEMRPPCAASDALRRPFFGDLHVHTGYSLDASTQGGPLAPRRCLPLRQGRAARHPALRP